MAPRRCHWSRRRTCRPEPRAKPRRDAAGRPPAVPGRAARRRVRRSGATSWTRSWARPATVCAYVPVGSEPGSPAMLRRAARTLRRRCCCRSPGPTTDGAAPAAAWGEYVPGALVAARFGLREPPPPWLPAEPWPGARSVLVPALAVDRAASGWAAAPASTTGRCRWPTADRLIAVVRDDEIRRRAARRTARRADDARR